MYFQFHKATYCYEVIYTSSKEGLHKQIKQMSYDDKINFEADCSNTNFYTTQVFKKANLLAKYINIPK